MSLPNELAMLDATAQAALVRNKEVTPIELVDAAIARIERRHHGEGVVVHQDAAAVLTRRRCVLRQRRELSRLERSAAALRGRRRQARVIR